MAAARPYWTVALWFLVGAALYSALLAVEAVVVRRRPQRDALVATLRALASLAAERGAGEEVSAQAKQRARAALSAYDQLSITLRANAQGPTSDYARAGMISRAVDQLMARLLAHDADAALCAATADRLTTCADALAAGRRPPPATSAPGTLVRLAMLEAALWDPLPAARSIPRADRLRVRAPSPSLWASAGRLALCTGLAYVAYFVVPLPHPYWVALTVALVMKPDLGSVFARGVLRSVGTVAGAVVAVGMVLLIAEPVMLSAVVMVIAACLPWAAARSYATQAFMMTPLIMVLLTLVEPDAHVVELSVARVATTLLGAVIVIVAGYLVWPGARHAHVAATVEQAVILLARYARDTAGGADADAIAADRRNAYRTLSDAKVGAQRRLSEPPPAGREALAWIPVITTAERVADRITDASASRPPVDVSGDVPALHRIADELAALARGDASPQDDAVRDPQVSRSAPDAADAVVRELADEVAALAAMLRAPHSSWTRGPSRAGAEPRERDTAEG